MNDQHGSHHMVNHENIPSPSYAVLLYHYLLPVLL